MLVRLCAGLDCGSQAISRSIARPAGLRLGTYERVGVGELVGRVRLTEVARAHRQRALEARDVRFEPTLEPRPVLRGVAARPFGHRRRLLGRPRPFSCSRQPSLIATTAYFVAECCTCGPPTRPAPEAVLTIWPPSPCAAISGANVSTPCTTPRMLTAFCQSNSASLISPIGALTATPALLQTTCALPNLAIVSSAAANCALGRTKWPRRRGARRKLEP